MFIRLCCQVIFSVAITHTYGQEPSYIHYDIDNGLPTSEVYQSIQDENGFMWFATDAGLVRFDGQEFEVYTKENGLGSNTVFGFHKDHLDRIWFYTFRGGVAYLEDGNIVVPTFNQDLIDTVGNGIISSMTVDFNNSIWLSFKRELFVVRIELETNTIEKISIHKKGFLGHVTSIDSSHYVYGAISNYFPRAKIQFNYIEENRLKKTTSSPYYISTTPLVSKNFSFLKTGKKSFFTYGKQLVNFKNDSVIQKKKLSSEVTMSLSIDQDTNIWIGLYKAGAICFSPQNLKQSKMHVLKNQSVSYIYEDSENGFWFTTLNNGIFYAPNLWMTSKSYLDSRNIQSKITVVHVNENQLLIGTENGELIDQPKPLNKDFNRLYQNLGKVDYIFEDGSSTYVGVFKSNHPNKGNHSFQDYHLIKTAFYYKSATSGLLYLPYMPYMVGEEDFPSEKFTGLNWNASEIGYIKSICEWKGKILLGGTEGIHQSPIDRLEDEVWEPMLDREDLYVLELLEREGYLFIATRYNGLIIFNEDTTWHIDEDYGLLTNWINTIEFQNDTTIWLGTNKGVSRLIFNTKYDQPKVFNLTRSSGLISDRVTDLTTFLDTLWIATDKGITYFNYNSLSEPKLNLDVRLDKVLVNDYPLRGSLDQTFDYTQNVFEFNFVAPNYKNADQLRYQYRLLGLEDEWKESSDGKQRYVLIPGEYKFEVSLVNSKGPENRTVYSFTILPPFWKQWWFIVFAATLIILIVGLVIKRQIFIQNKRKDLELDMARSKHLALSAQLKPHFVFNALNSLHNFIKKDNKESSISYLIMLSKLIRQILNNSSDSFVSIKEELSLIEKYLSVEKMRFKDKMEYEIEVDPQLDIYSLKVPTQLIQPYVENAIWHGIMHKKGKGNILVKLERKENSVHCIIQDDGIGREQAASFSRKIIKHQPSGMKISEQRLKLIQAIIGKPLSIDIIDLKGEDNVPNGTLVLLKLPIIQNDA